MTGNKQKTLGDLAAGMRGRILRIAGLGPDASELEHRLLEMGFAEGDEVEVLHHGPVGRDPIAVKVCGRVLALRRAEAAAVVLKG